ncbi:DNA-formamidopyrimidine glycosylase family protein [Sanguibacter antarcticus]|uniref:DNA-(apurinic or apyrimidinic site) lyase n=1 Tax=Sanguibacter antarcticus TaxID=372484 RepID=A0A2A9E398_9MICO|nr:DNA-formamidopyrimidine glycosylase family protein [Sanguibacter antarcticus]PFG33507.1 endonuclease-8 [Sanguibacter antarcticus]
MPEGDTVLLTARRLDAALSGRPLVRSELRWPRVPVDELTGLVVVETVAYGKHLLTRLDDGWTLHTHLRMDGSWRVARTGAPDASARGAFVRAVLANETWTCVGHRLGMLDLVRTRDEHQLVGHLGPDILADDFTDRLDLLAPGGTVAGPLGACTVGDLLLDQTFVAGIGTLFACEGLFRLKMWPWSRARDVDVVTLLLTIRRHMLRGVAVPVDGREVKVHARAGRPCARCGDRVVRGVVGSAPTERPMFYCPTCQVPRPGQTDEGPGVTS